MNSVLRQSVGRIKRLDNRLANQIAAGEVVERPSSVVKELLENAIDSQATRIEVDIERGGTRLIRVTDNGIGIVKEDLELALSRHATSKLSCTQDLEQITSLGFRGEALASIASVSHLCLTSRTENAEFAWQAIAEGRDMQVKVQPASATLGTRVEVRELFFNTPARKKFLRAEKTEFGHIEEIFKRHALVNLGIAFILKHNGKVVKRVPAGADDEKYLRRIEAICGKPFTENAIPFSCQHEVININGWLGGCHYHRSESDIQYVFVNGRPVKDRTLNHAIRQSYQPLLPAGRMPTYVIFLQLAADKIDVNVHPTKHEVRFDEQRLVHDVLAKSVKDTLADNAELDFEYSDNINSGTQQRKETLTQHQNNSYESVWAKEKQVKPFSTQAIYQKAQQLVGTTSVEERLSKEYKIENEPRTHFNQSEVGSVAEVVESKKRFGNGIWLLINNNSVLLVDEKELMTRYLTSLMTQTDEEKQRIEVDSKPLLFPKLLSVDYSLLEDYQTLTKFQLLGFKFEPKEKNQILLRQVPRWLDGVEHQLIFNNIESWLSMLANFSQDYVLVDDDCIGINISKIYQTISPLSSNTFDFLIQENLTHNFAEGAIKEIDAELAKSIFSSELGA